MVKKVPTMIRDNGILAAAAFAAESKGHDGYKNPGHKKVFDCIIGHLASEGVRLLNGSMSLEDFIHAVCKFFNKKSVQIVEVDSHISD